MANYINVMVDLETLGSSPTAQILSIGACKFYRKIEQPLDDLYRDSFYIVVKGYHESEFFTVEESTLEWWDEQPEEAKQVLTAEGEKPAIAVKYFFDWLSSFNSPDSDDSIMLWARGINFDISILEYHAQMYRLTPPWRYNNISDQRTLVREYCQIYDDKVMPYVLPSPHGIKHNALDDAVYQVRVLQHLEQGKFSVR